MLTDTLRVLITVKTYPSLSNKYHETVCTAGIRADTGTWIRLYPIPYRSIEEYQQYEKWQWVTLRVKRNTSDFRPESYKPIGMDSLLLGDSIGTHNDPEWRERRKWVCNKVYDNLRTLIQEAKDKSICTSLATFKPTKFLDFVIEPDTREWDASKLKAIMERQKQGSLFEEKFNRFKAVVHKLPYKFSYKIEDSEGKQSTMMIEDWEIGALYWNCLRRHNGNEALACADVKEKYWTQFTQKKDVHLFLGTTKEFHFIGPNPFVIIGVFYPSYPSPQQSLF